MVKKILLITFILISVKLFATDYYVSTNGNDSNNGLSESTAWKTMTYAATIAKAGDTVWIKAGNYGNENVVMKNSGVIGNPITFTGYKNSPGDITSMYYTYAQNKPLDPAEMPMLKGNNILDGRGIELEGKEYININNIQITIYRHNIMVLRNSNNIKLNNIISKDAGRACYAVQSYDSYNISITNSIGINGGMAIYRFYGQGHIIDNCKAYADTSSNDSTDYYMSIRGTDHIIRNSYLERVGNVGHQGHGLTLKAQGVKTENNLIENCKVVNINGAVELRHSQVRNNIIRNIEIRGPYGKIVIRDGANNNIIENCFVEGTSGGIRFYDQAGEDGEGGILGSDNVIRNSIFQNITTGIEARKSNSVKAIGIVSRNRIENCVFYNISTLFLTSIPVDNTNIIENTIFSNIGRDEGSSSIYPILWKFNNNNFYDNGFSQFSGSNNITGNPKFTDPSKGDFHIELGSSAIDAGKTLVGVETDYEGNLRPQGNAYDIGAFEKIDPTGSVNADAGPDVTICTGQSTILTASGGTSYLWSTGETTESITVNPTATTTYSVTVTEGADSDSDDVIVTVDEAPSVELGPDQSICYGETITLTAIGTGDFLWNTGETTSSITVNPTTTATYSVTASNSCTIDATDEIIINVIPEIGLAVGNDVSICVGESTTLTATGNGDFLWNTGETTPSITVIPNTTTTYTVTSTIGTCTESASIIVTVSEIPTVDLGADQSICFGETVILTATGTGDFLWNTGERTPSITVSPTTTTTYSVTASNSCATDATDEIIINVNPEIGLTIGNDISICQGESTTLTASGNGDFLWSTGETTPSITVQPNSTTTYSVSSGLGACSETESVLVTVDVAPSVDLGPDQSICFGETVMLTASGTGDFLWNTGETTPSITVSPTTTTTYTVIASNACTDSVSDEIIINVNPEIGLTIGNDISICTGESTTLTATGNGDFLWSTGETTSSITVQPNSTTIYTVTSSLGNCTENESVTVTINDSSSVDLGPDKTICYDESVTLTATGSGNFLWSTGETTASITVTPITTTTYSVTASNSCSSDATDEITVNVNDVPIVNAGGDITIINGESTTLTATGTGSFLWSTGETSPSITVSPTSTTSYSVELTSDQGCSDQDSVIVTVENAESSYADAGPDQNVCPNTDVVLTASGGDSYLWSTGETTASITVSPSITSVYTVAVYQGNTHTYDDVTVYIDENCSENFTVQAEFKLYPNPTHGILHIETNGLRGDLNVSIFNLNGSLVHTEVLNNSSKEKISKQKINLNKFEKGTYFVILNSNEGSETKKIILI